MAFDGLNKKNWQITHDDSLASGDRTVEVETRMYGEGYEPISSVRTVPGPDLCVDQDMGLKTIPGQTPDKD